jgi:hypothetical protein
MRFFWVNLTARLPGKKPDKRFIALTLVEINSFYTERYEMVEKLDAVINKVPEMEEEGISK